MSFRGRCAPRLSLTTIYPLHASPTPPQTTTSRVSNKIRIKEGIDFSQSTAGLDLSPAVGRIKGSPRYCWVAHHLARLRIYFFHQPHVLLRSSVNPAAAIVGGNWGESGASAALGSIYRPNDPPVCAACPLRQAN